MHTKSHVLTNVSQQGALKIDYEMCQIHIYEDVPQQSGIEITSNHTLSQIYHNTVHKKSIFPQMYRNRVYSKLITKYVK